MTDISALGMRERSSEKGNEDAALPAALLLLHTHVACSLKCFSDVGATETTRCAERKGLQTCFIKYDQGSSVVGRGCSTKSKRFQIRCENHQMGQGGERFCYCSSSLCNKADQVGQHLLLLFLLPLLLLLHHLHGQPR